MQTISHGLLNGFLPTDQWVILVDHLVAHAAYGVHDDNEADLPSEAMAGWSLWPGLLAAVLLSCGEEVRKVVRDSGRAGVKVSDAS